MAPHSFSEITAAIRADEPAPRPKAALWRRAGECTAYVARGIGWAREKRATKDDLEKLKERPRLRQFSPAHGTCHLLCRLVEGSGLSPAETVGAFDGLLPCRLEVDDGRPSSAREKMA